MSNNLLYGSDLYMEWLSDVCYNCGCMGHVMSSCQMVVCNHKGVLDPRGDFNPWLRVTQNLTGMLNKEKESSYYEVSRTRGFYLGSL